jgi:hypothetical protein
MDAQQTDNCPQAATWPHVDVMLAATRDGAATDGRMRSRCISRRATAARG